MNRHWPLSHQLVCLRLPGQSINTGLPVYMTVTHSSHLSLSGFTIHSHDEYDTHYIQLFYGWAGTGRLQVCCSWWHQHIGEQATILLFIVPPLSLRGRLCFCRLWQYHHLGEASCVVVHSDTVHFGEAVCVLVVHSVTIIFKRQSVFLSFMVIPTFGKAGCGLDVWRGYQWRQKRGAQTKGGSCPLLSDHPKGAAAPFCREVGR